MWVKNVFLAVAAFLDVGPLVAATLNVPADWPTLPAAIGAAVNGDTVLAAPGEYVLDSPLDFRGKSLLLLSEKGPQETILRRSPSARDPRGSVAVFDDPAESGSSIEGFTLTGGTG